MCNADFDAACDLFKEVQKRDPYSLEHVDTYSNILYVKVRSSVDLCWVRAFQITCTVNAEVEKKSCPFIQDK